VTRLADGEIARQTPKNPVQPISTGAVPPLPSGLSNKAYDGALMGQGNVAYPRNAPLSSIPPVQPQLPKGQQALPGLVVYLNGVEEDATGEDTSLQHLANATKTPAVGIYNANEGLEIDLEHVVEDRMGIGNRGAWVTCSSLLYDSLKAGRPLRLMGYSQGAIIISRSLEDVQRKLEDQGMSQKQVQELFKRYVTVETFAGATNYYPDGPFYVHYVNRLDFSQLYSAFEFGAGPPFTHPGEGAVSIYFSQPPPLWGHSLARAYLPHYVPLDEVKRRAAKP
jgi:hypothetical protein